MSDALPVNSRLPQPSRELTLNKRLQNALGRDWNVAYVFMLPTVILMGGIIAFPFLRAFYISFTNTTTREIGPWVGLTNYINLWTDIFYRRAVVVTAKYTIGAVSLKVLVGLLASILLNRLGNKASFWTGLVLLPWIMPEIVRAITWKGLLDPMYGGVSRALMELKLIKAPLPFLGGVNTALPPVIMPTRWAGIPFFTINVLAGLKAIDHELYEAASIDGATPWRQFLHITLPGLRYVLIVVTLLSTIWTFNAFTEIFLLTGGGPMDATKVYSILAYNYAIGGLRYGPGIAVSMTMAPVLGIFIVVLGLNMMSGRRLYEEQTAKTPGVFSAIGAVIAWPFKMIIRLLLAIFWLINNAIEAAIEKLGALLQKGRDEALAGKRRKKMRWTRNILPMLALVLLLSFELLPFYWVINTAL